MHGTSPLLRASTDSTTRTALLGRIGLPLPLRSGYRLLRESDRWACLGDQLVHQDRPEAALAAFEQALALEPDNAAFINAVVAILSGLKRPRAALRILHERPATADFLAMQATLELDIGAAESSLTACDEALTLRDDHFVARLNRGAALRALQRTADVLENDRQLVGRFPGHPLAHYNHGDALLAAGRHADALDALNESLKLAPDYVPALMARGLALTMLRRFAEAARTFAAAREKDAAAARAYVEQAARAAGLSDADDLPDDPCGIYLSWMARAQNSCDWRERSALESLLPTVFAEANNLVHCEPGLAFNVLLLDLPHWIQQEVARRAALSAQEKAAKWDIPVDRSRTQPAIPAPARRLRIGFISPDFRPHPVVDIHWRQLQLHDRKRFDIFAYSLHDHGPSEARRSIETSCDHFVEISLLSTEAGAQRIAADGIDILVDLTGYTVGTRPEILAARPARIQVQHIGTPGPSGATFIDYRITDKRVTPPEEEPDWDESLVWLPDTFWLVDDTLTIAAAPSRARCGLPDDAFVFCCFNNHQKIDPAVFDIWMRLLKNVPGSVLWLIAGSPESERNLAAEADARGVTAGRLIFSRRMPLPEHLARHAQADLFLDTFNYNAHTTAVDALRCGLPLLTCFGRTMAGRIAGSLLNAVGLPDMVTHTHADYEERALHLATHPAELASLRQRLLDARATAPLFQTERRVRQIERAYEQMWARHAAGLVPESFEVME